MQVSSRMSRENCPGEVQELSKTSGVKTVAVGIKRELNSLPLKQKVEVFWSTGVS